MRGCGRQTLGAYLNLIGWWGVTIPLAVFLGLHQGLGTRGFWIALASGTSGQALFFLCVLSRLDWQKEVQRAKVLVDSHRETGGEEDAQAAAAAAAAERESDWLARPHATLRDSLAVPLLGGKESP